MKDERQILEENKACWEEDYRHLTLSNDFMFSYIMKKPAHHKKLVELLSGEVTKSVKLEATQKTLQSAAYSKYVRLDMFLELDWGLCDIEMQTRTIKDLGLRSRYYASNMDNIWTHKGTSYKDMKAILVMFLSLTDMFGKGLYKYTFRSTCIEDNSLTLDDKVTKIVYTCSEWEKCPNPELRAFLHYLHDGTITSDWTRDLDKDVQEERLCGIGRKEFMDTMTYRLLCMDEAYEQAKKDYEVQLRTKDSQLAAKDRKIAAYADQIAQMRAQLASYQSAR